MRHEVTSGDALMTLSSTGKALSSAGKSAAFESMARTAGRESCPGTNRLQRLEAIAAILHVDDLAVARAKALEQLDRVATVRSAPLQANYETRVGLRDHLCSGIHGLLNDAFAGGEGPTGPPQARVSWACGAP